MTHAEFEMELVEALNMLLEDERASVEMEVALASGATEYGERDTLATMGREDIHFCEQLRTEMEQAGLPVSPQINGVVFQVVGAERYDDRLRAFAHHQRVVAEHARELQESNLEGGLREALEGIVLTHDRHTEWTERRANAFAATRTLEFGATGRVSSPPETLTEASAEPEAPAQQYSERRPDTSAGDATDALGGEPKEGLPPEDARASEFEPAEREVEREAAPEAPVAEAPAPKPRTRAPSRAASRTTTPATPKARAKATTKAKSSPKTATTPRRTRRVPADGEGGD